MCGCKGAAKDELRSKITKARLGEPLHTSRNRRGKRIRDSWPSWRNLEKASVCFLYELRGEDKTEARPGKWKVLSSEK